MDMFVLKASVTTRERNFDRFERRFSGMITYHINLYPNTYEKQFDLW